MIGKQTLYFCDPQKNKVCNRSGCALYGGTCYSTAKKEYALLYANRDPQVITPKKQLEMQGYQAILKLAKNSSKNKYSFKPPLYSDRLRGLIEKGELTRNDARRLLGLSPIKVPGADLLLTEKSD